MNATSKNLRGATEITLLANVKQGWVEAPDRITYATRLRKTLGLLQALRKGSEETRPSPLPGPLERLRMIRFFHWALVNDDRDLLLAVSFDGPWEAYIRRIADVAGPLIDLIFCHCEGYEGNATDESYAAFASWIRDRQIECDFIFAAETDLTTDDVRYLKEFERRAACAAAPGPEAPRAPTTFALEPFFERRPMADVFFPIVSGFHAVRPFFASDPTSARFLDGAAMMLALPFDPEAAPDPVIEVANRDRTTPPGTNAEVLRWAAELRAAAPAPRREPQVEVPACDPADVQGNILTGYKRMTHGALVFVQFDSSEAGRAFLGALAPRITTEADAALAPPLTTNLALTMNGLERLGLAPEVLRTLPKEFRQGLATRAAILGMVGEAHPRRWVPPTRNWPVEEPGDLVPLETIDAVVLLQGRFDGEREGDHRFDTDHPLREGVRGIEAAGARVLAVEPLRRFLNGTEVHDHLGFKDGISQPIPRAIPANGERFDGDEVALGEILLGHLNGRGEIAGEGPAELLRNGSFLAITKLVQEVDAFEAYVAAQGAGWKDDLLKARLLGRWPNGEPLLPSRGEDQNTFDYAGDKEGQVCPLLAHVRRAHPREALTTWQGKKVQGPRIMRRGFGFGPKRSGRRDEERAARSGETRGAQTDEERGVMFMAFNASLADQYELIQRWVNGGNSTGTLSTHADLIGGVGYQSAGRHIDLHDGDEWQRIQAPETPPVALRWGLYLFTPGVAAVRALAAGLPAATRARHEAPAVSSKGLFAPSPHEPIGQLVERLRGLGDGSKEIWQRLLYDEGARARALEIWAWVRANGGFIDTPIGVLASGAEAALRVLGDEASFSARAYWHRSKASFGEMIIGLDRTPHAMPEGARDAADDEFEAAVRPGRAAREADPVRAAIAAIGREEARREAEGATVAALGAAARGAQGGLHVGLDALAYDVLFRLAGTWFGMPKGAHLRPGVEMTPQLWVQTFSAVARSIFAPEPTAIARGQGAAIGKRLLEVAGEFVDEVTLHGAESPLLQRLANAGTDQSRDDLARAWIGAVHGFLVPTAATFLRVVAGWMKTGELWRLQQALRPLPDAEGRSAIVTGRLLAAMRTASVPDLVHRRSVTEVPLPDGTRVPAGRPFLVSLHAAAAERPADEALLFGGGAGAHPPHACPGQEMGIGVLSGMVGALALQRGLRADPLNAPFGLVFAPPSARAGACE